MPNLENDFLFSLKRNTPVPIPNGTITVDGIAIEGGLTAKELRAVKEVLAKSAQREGWMDDLKATFQERMKNAKTRPQNSTSKAKDDGNSTTP